MEGRLSHNTIGLLKETLWDILVVSWLSVAITKRGELISLPNTVRVSLLDKYRLRKIYSDDCKFYVMAKQGHNWYSLHGTGPDTSLPTENFPDPVVKPSQGLEVSEL